MKKWNFSNGHTQMWRSSMIEGRRSLLQLSQHAQRLHHLLHLHLLFLHPPLIGYFIPPITFPSSAHEIVSSVASLFSLMSSISSLPSIRPSASSSSLSLSLHSVAPFLLFHCVSQYLTFFVFLRLCQKWLTAGVVICDLFAPEYGRDQWQKF